MSPKTLAPGTRLAHYQIIDRLGAGGMGEVYRAHDPGLERDVAIKVLANDLADDNEMRGRFEREARAVAALSHPGILSIHELGCVEGLTFAVMELLKGESLRERVARGPVPWRTAAKLGAQAAEALAAAHIKGIVHRDIKPENLFVVTDGWLKVLDFGLARWTPPGPPNAVLTQAVLTQPRELLGSVGYMAPEQALGEPVGPSADIFALGCVIYEMVTGERAFDGETPAETIAAILRASPHQMRERVPDVPLALERIVTHCLARNPTERFANASDVASALRAVAIESEPGVALPPIARKSRSVEGSVAVLPFTYTGEPSTDYLADSLTEAVINRLSLMQGLRVVPRSTAFRYKGRDLDVTNVGLALNVRSIVSGRILKRGELVTIQAELIDVATQAQVWGHHYRYSMSDLQAFDDEAAQHIIEALAVHLSRDHVKRLRRRQTLDSEAYHEYLRGRHHWLRWNAESMANAIAHFERSIECDPTFALGWSGLGEALVVGGYFAFIPPADALARGLKAARRAADLDPSLAEAHASVGLAMLLVERDWERAESEIRNSIEINRHLAVGHAYLGLLLAARGSRNEAVIAAQRACDLEPFSLMMNQIHCWVLFLCGEYEEGLAQARRVLAEDDGFAEARRMVIACNEALGRLDKAADEWAHYLGVLGDRQDRSGRIKTALETRGPQGYWEERLTLTREVTNVTGGLGLLVQAHVLSHLGRLDEAMVLINQLTDGPYPQAICLGGRPFVDAFRGHPDFERLLERVRPRSHMTGAVLASITSQKL